MFKLSLSILLGSICLQYAFATTKLFMHNCLDEHNRYRAMHDAPPLVLDETLQAWAQDWADYLAGPSPLAYGKNPDKRYGENLFAFFGRTCVNAKAVVTRWYDTISNYNFESNSPRFQVAQQFAQVVWKNSTKLGCATAISESSKRVYVVANYDPPGNKGSYAANVSPKTN